MDESRADWRTFGEMDGTAAVSGARGPGSAAPSAAGAPTGSWAALAEGGPSWPVGRAGHDTDPASGGPAGAVGHASRLLPIAVTAAACALAVAVVLVALGAGGASALVVDGGNGVGAAAAGPSARSEGTAGGAAPSDGPGSSAGAGGAAAEPIVVDVEGAVPRPGLVRLASGSRVGDAIAAAGGYAPTVDVARAAGEVNLAARVADGDRVRVPATGDAPEPASGPASSAAASSTGSGAAGLVDVNRASASELDALPGIGPVTAEKIIKARTTAAFRAVQDLRDRKVVTASTYAKIEPLVTVGP
jgi:competence protein ComEA